MSTTKNPEAEKSVPDPTKSRGALWRGLALGAGGILCLAATLGGMRIAAAARAVPDDRHIVAGVKIGAVPVGGLTADEALEKTKAWAQAALQKPVTFITPVSKKTWNLTLAEVGGRFDREGAVREALLIGRNETLWQQLVMGDKRDVNLAPKFLLNERWLERELGKIGKKVRVAPRNVRISVSGGNVKILTPEREGYRLDVVATKAALLKGSPDTLRDGGSATLVITEDRPQITAADARAITTVLASYRTDYSFSIPGRKHNVEMATERLNGALVAPGDVFSYNDQVGERRAEDGWQNAKMYKDGEVIDGTGAGVCQVSSTLYNVALRADMKIVERSPHSMPVHYVPAGRDATVVYGATDFRFKNVTDGPIYLSSVNDGGDVLITLWGKKPANPKRVRLITASIDGLPDGGYRSKTYKEVTDADGKSTREYLSTDTYHMPKTPQ